MPMKTGNSSSEAQGRLDTADVLSRALLVASSSQRLLPPPVAPDGSDSAGTLSSPSAACSYSLTTQRHRYSASASAVRLSLQREIGKVCRLLSRGLAHGGDDDGDNDHKRFATAHLEHSAKPARKTKRQSPARGSDDGVLPFSMERLLVENAHQLMDRLLASHPSAGVDASSTTARRGGAAVLPTEQQQQRSGGGGGVGWRNQPSSLNPSKLCLDALFVATDATDATAATAATAASRTNWGRESNLSDASTTLSRGPSFFGSAAASGSPAHRHRRLSFVSQAWESEVVGNNFAGGDSFAFRRNNGGQGPLYGDACAPSLYGDDDTFFSSGGTTASFPFWRSHMTQRESLLLGAGGYAYAPRGGPTPTNVRPPPRSHSHTMSFGSQRSTADHSFVSVPASNALLRGDSKDSAGLEASLLERTSNPYARMLNQLYHWEHEVRQDQRLAYKTIQSARRALGDAASSTASIDGNSSCGGGGDSHTLRRRSSQSVMAMDSLEGSPTTEAAGDEETNAGTTADRRRATGGEMEAVFVDEVRVSSMAFGLLDRLEEEDVSSSYDGATGSTGGGEDTRGSGLLSPHGSSLSCHQQPSTASSFGGTDNTAAGAGAGCVYFAIRSNHHHHHSHPNDAAPSSAASARIGLFHTGLASAVASHLWYEALPYERHPIRKCLDWFVDQQADVILACMRASCIAFELEEALPTDRAAATTAALVSVAATASGTCDTGRGAEEVDDPSTRRRDHSAPVSASPFTPNTAKRLWARDRISFVAALSDTFAERMFVARSIPVSLDLPAPPWEPTGMVDTSWRRLSARMAAEDTSRAHSEAARKGGSSKRRGLFSGSKKAQQQQSDISSYNDPLSATASPAASPNRPEPSPRPTLTDNGRNGAHPDTGTGDGGRRGGGVSSLLGVMRKVRSTLATPRHGEEDNAAAGRQGSDGVIIRKRHDGSPSRCHHANNNSNLSEDPNAVLTVERDVSPVPVVMVSDNEVDGDRRHRAPSIVSISSSTYTAGSPDLVAGGGSCSYPVCVAIGPIFRECVPASLDAFLYWLVLRAVLQRAVGGADALSVRVSSAAAAVADNSEPLMAATPHFSGLSRAGVLMLNGAAQQLDAFFGVWLHRALSYTATTAVPPASIGVPSGSPPQWATPATDINELMQFLEQTFLVVQVAATYSTRTKDGRPNEAGADVLLPLAVGMCSCCRYRRLLLVVLQWMDGGALYPSPVYGKGAMAYVFMTFMAALTAAE